MNKYYVGPRCPQSIIQRRSRAKDNQRRLFNLIKNRAKNKNLDFDLVDKHDIIIPPRCPYLGIEFEYGHPDYSMSVDRIDCTKGYTKDNIEVISTLANRMKNKATLKQLIAFAKEALRRYA
jgi:hypothetical protein